mmetsp:Transcript_1607/g.3171  ORF Transcript_1607/g.3171 Transcript_1607/m.3171 type:complete len:772 (+) Transcript_1607:132-2447(+)
MPVLTSLEGQYRSSNMTPTGTGRLSSDDQFDRHLDEGDGDRLFHLQQTFLREELPQNKWREIQHYQSQELNMPMQAQQDHFMWQRRRRLQVQQSEKLRRSMPDEPSERVMADIEDKRKMRASFNLFNDYSIDGPFHSSSKESSVPPLFFHCERKPIDERHNASISLRGQSQHLSGGNEGTLHSSRSAGSLRAYSYPLHNGPTNNNGNNDIFPMRSHYEESRKAQPSRKSYLDEPSIQPHLDQCSNFSLYPKKESPIGFQLQSNRNNGGEVARGAAASPLVQNSSSLSKRRRVEPYEINSPTNEKLMLDMLNDTVVSPKTTKPNADFSTRNRNNNSLGIDTSDRASVTNWAMLSPFSRYLKPTSHNEDASLSPLEVNKGDAFVGSTPRLFANVFLDNRGIGNVLDNAMPPPPLFNSNNIERNKNKDISGVALLDACLRSRPCDLPNSLPLPPRKSQHRYGKNGKKKQGRTKGQKKNKDGPSSSDNAVRDTSNHIITPTSASITALSAEVRSKMQSISSSQKGKDVESSTDRRPSDESNSDGAFVPKFASTMEASQASQQAIHDWDRKMGLRRAHSKTMRESCRSRKRVLDFLNGEGSNLLLLTKSLSSKDGDSRTSSSNTTITSNPSTDVSSLPISTEEREPGSLPGLANKKPGQLGNHVEVKKGPCKKANVVPTSPSATLASLSQFQGAGIDSRHVSADVPKHGSDSKSQSYESPKLHGKGNADAQLEKMFRRASLDCVKSVFPGILSTTGVTPPSPPEEADRKQCYAKSA